MDGQEAAGDLQPHRELVRIGGLGQEVVGAGAEAFQLVLAAILAGQQDDVDVALEGAGPDVPAELQAVHPGHDPVGDHEGDLIGFEESRRLEAVDRHDGLVAHPFEGPAKEKGRGGLVFRDQDLHEALSRWSFNNGSSVSQAE